jgi:hypothetical protein
MSVNMIVVSRRVGVLTESSVVGGASAARRLGQHDGRNEDRRTLTAT